MLKGNSTVIKLKNSRRLGIIVLICHNKWLATFISHSIFLVYYFTFCKVYIKKLVDKCHFHRSFNFTLLYFYEIGFQNAHSLTVTWCFHHPRRQSPKSPRRLVYFRTVLVQIHSPTNLAPAPAFPFPSLRLFLFAKHASCLLILLYWFSVGSTYGSTPVRFAFVRYPGTPIILTFHIPTDSKPANSVSLLHLESNDRVWFFNEDWPYVYFLMVGSLSDSE